MKRVLFFVVLVSLSVGGTQQQRAKTFGGSASLSLPAGQKLVNATWKDDQLWYLTRTMRSDENPESYTFSESSSFGILQGKVIITESK